MHPQQSLLSSAAQPTGENTRRAMTIAVTMAEARFILTIYRSEGAGPQMTRPDSIVVAPHDDFESCRGWVTTTTFSNTVASRRASRVAAVGRAITILRRLRNKEKRDGIHCTLVVRHQVRSQGCGARALQEVEPRVRPAGRLRQAGRPLRLDRRAGVAHVEIDCTFQSLADLEKAFANIGNLPGHAAWGKELEPHIVSGSNKWEIFRPLDLG
jgi:hypothetical protein